MPERISDDILRILEVPAFFIHFTYAFDYVSGKARFFGDYCYHYYIYYHAYADKSIDRNI